MKVFGLTSRGDASRASSEATSIVTAIARSQAMIEFALDGTVLTANENFLKVMGYELSEITGQHHRMFADPAHAASPDYKRFWEDLGRGEYRSGEFRRLGKGGKEVWIQGSYNPIFGKDGKPYKVVKFVSDITAAKLAGTDAAGQLAAIGKSLAVIEFTATGDILTANPNFCSALGYHLDEIKGRHHRMFVAPDYAASADYRDFWERLGRGQYQAAEYLRIGKGGKEVWIQATYNPILDEGGRVLKVVKYATDITGRKAAVNMLGQGLARLAEGDLTAHIATEFVGELDEVRHAFNETVERFADIISGLRRTSGTLKTATGEILSGANDLSERTTRQAAAIEETSAAMDQLASTVTENAKRADVASAKARSVSETAEQGGVVMHQASDAMERITASSAKISNIIGMIDDIAFQTNLLALNASVEAARAGDAGKGFAVVAVEVRRLAQSAASASSDVKALIEQSSGEVSTGSRLVADAAAKLADMLQGVKENAALINAIASASQEQSTAIGQVGAAVRQMDEMTQHNAALVEETNAAIEQTEAQAKELDKVVEIFVVDAPRSERSDRVVEARQPVHRSVSMQGRAKVAAATYLKPVAAVGQDWSEF